MMFKNFARVALISSFFLTEILPAAPGNLLWEKHGGGEYSIRGDEIYRFSNNFLSRLSMATGDEIWAVKGNPVLADDESFCSSSSRLIVLTGISTTFAVSASDGTVKWKIDSADTAIGSLISSLTPSVICNPRINLVIVDNVAHDLETGRRLWKVPEIEGKSLAFARSHESGLMFIYQDQMSLNNPQGIEVDISTGKFKFVYECPLQSAVFEHWGNRIWCADNIGNIASLSSVSGIPEWINRGQVRRWPKLVSKNRLMTQTNQIELGQYDFIDTTNGRTLLHYISPVTEAGFREMKTDNEKVAFNVIDLNKGVLRSDVYDHDGNFIWQTDGLLILSGATYKIGAGRVDRLHAMTGAALWTQNIDGTISSIVTSEDTSILEISNDDFTSVVALDLESGVRKWQIQLKKTSSINMVQVNENRLYVRSFDSFAVIEL